MAYSFIFLEKFINLLLLYVSQSFGFPLLDRYYYPNMMMGVCMGAREDFRTCHMGRYRDKK
jgi:hypothetical protein